MPFHIFPPKTEPVKKKSISPLMKEISLIALSAIQKNIEKNIPPQNANLTQAVKQGGQTLKDRGTLRASLFARSNAQSASVGTKISYALIHNPPDGKTETIIRPKKAKFLCLPASPFTRTLQRRHGFSAREVIQGLEERGHAVYRPYKKGGGVRSNVIMAKKTSDKNAKPFPVFILKKEIRIPARPFMYLDEDVINVLSTKIGDYFDEKK